MKQGSHLRVARWGEFQHYRNRTPPWIKLYNHLLDDPDFDSIPSPTRFYLPFIWLLASRNNGVVPDDAAWIQRKIGSPEMPDIQVLVNKGFLERQQDASAALASCGQDACAEREREGERETERERETDSAEPSADAESPAPVVSGFLTSGKGVTWDLRVDLFGELQDAYPGVDILAEARKAKAWCMANPTRRKTARGMPRFLNQWLEKCQNGAGSVRAAPGGRESPGEHTRRSFETYLQQKGIFDGQARTGDSDSDGLEVG